MAERKRFLKWSLQMLLNSLGGIHSERPLPCGRGSVDSCKHPRPKPVCALSLLLFLGSVLWAGDESRIVYSKSFPGSVPAFMQVTLDKSGNADYREAPDDELPLKFHLDEPQVQEIFGLAEKLDYFKRPLESGLKVAFMGAKTFRYEKGDQKTEVKFNYSEDLNAHAILDWFERMAESAEARIELEKAAKYDKLGVFKALTILQGAMDRKRLVGLDQYLPTLDRIIKNESYMHAARARASEIAEAIRANKP